MLPVEAGQEQPNQLTIPRNTRFYARAVLTPEQYSKNASKYAIEILPHLDLEYVIVERLLRRRARSLKVN
jgi:hypothetical protein